jgi:hypothetical protein
MEIDSFVVPVIVQLILPSQTTRPDLDQLTREVRQWDSSDTGVQTFTMSGTIDLDALRPRPGTNEVPGALQ